MSSSTPHSPAGETPSGRPSHRRATRIALVLLVIVFVAGAAVTGWALIDSSDNGPARADAATTEPSASEQPTTTTTEKPKPTTTTTTIPKLKQPPAAVLPALNGGRLTYGSSGDVVKAYELRLKQLRFDPGPVDGAFDQDLSYAVQSVQKLLDLPVTGAIDEATALKLMAFKYPKPLEPKSEADRVEISLDRQTLVLYKGWQIELITTTSTGSGEHFCGGDDGCQYAVTPPGRFEFQWHYNGWKKGKLGTLWNPYYFNGGIAVHGYSSVPTHPASHGCARIPMNIANYFPDLVYKGMAVFVVGAPPELPTGVPVENPDPDPPAATTAPTTAATPITPPATQPHTTTTKPHTTTTKKPTTTTTKKPTTTTTHP